MIISRPGLRRIVVDDENMTQAPPATSRDQQRSNVTPHFAPSPEIIPIVKPMPLIDNNRPPHPLENPPMAPPVGTVPPPVEPPVVAPPVASDPPPAAFTAEEEAELDALLAKKDHAEHPTT